MTRPGSLAPVPSLPDILADPGLMPRLPRAVAIEYRRAIKRLEADLEAHIAGELASAAAHDGGNETLDVAQAATMLGLAVDTLYRRARKPPFAAFLVPTGTRRLVFSRRRIEEHVARRVGR